MFLLLNTPNDKVGDTFLLLRVDLVNQYKIFIIISGKLCIIYYLDILLPGGQSIGKYSSKKGGAGADVIIRICFFFGVSFAGRYFDYFDSISIVNIHPSVISLGREILPKTLNIPLQVIMEERADITRAECCLNWWKDNYCNVLKVLVGSGALLGVLYFIIFVY